MLMKITYFCLPDSQMVNAPAGEVSVGPRPCQLRGLGAPLSPGDVTNMDLNTPCGQHSDRRRAPEGASCPRPADDARGAGEVRREGREKAGSERLQHPRQRFQK